MAIVQFKEKKLKSPFMLLIVFTFFTALFMILKMFGVYNIVPESYDDRFTDEFLENNIASVGIPLFVGKLATGAISLTGKTTSQFIDMVKKKFRL